jgi:hypothetical protein
VGLSGGIEQDFLSKTLLLRKSLYGKFASQKTCVKRKIKETCAKEIK